MILKSAENLCANCLIKILEKKHQCSGLKDLRV